MKVYSIILLFLFIGCSSDDMGISPQFQADPARFISFGIAEYRIYEDLDEKLGLGSALFIYDLQDSTLERLYDNSAYIFEWSNDGKLAHVRPHTTTLVIEDFKNNRSITEIELHQEYVHNMAWSHDGKKLAFSHRGDKIDVVDILTGEIETPVSISEGDSALHNPAWSPDDQNLFYILGLLRPDDDGRNISVQDFFVRDMTINNSSAPKFDTRIEMFDDFTGPIFFSWTPESNSIVYGQRGRIFEYNMLNSNLRQISANQDRIYRITLSPRNDKIAYRLSHAYDDGYYDHETLYQINFDGSGREKLTELQITSSPDWSKDGKHIVFANEQGLYSLDFVSRNTSLLVKIENEHLRNSEDSEVDIFLPKWVHF